MPICLRLLTHCARRAASRAAWTAGSSRAIKMAMIEITTKELDEREATPPSVCHDDFYPLMSERQWAGRVALPLIRNQSTEFVRRTCGWAASTHGGKA